MLVSAGCEPGPACERRARAIYTAFAGAQLIARTRADVNLFDELMLSYQDAALIPTAFENGTPVCMLRAAGRQLPDPMTDPRWSAADGWVKSAKNINGVEINYVRNSITGAIEDFKFK